jgi:hypothetical protein
MARNAEGLTVEEVLCPTDSADQRETTSGFEIATRNLSLFSFHVADDGNGVKWRTTKYFHKESDAWFVIMMSIISVRLS